MTQILMRRGTAAQWAASNPVLGSGEIGYEIDAKKFRLGDGVTRFGSLPTYLPVEILSTLFAPAGSGGGGGGGMTLEQIQDAVYDMFGAGSHTGLQFVYDDTIGRINVTVNESDLGKIRGEWHSAANPPYVIGQYVTYYDTIYRCDVDETASVPGDDNDWIPVTFTDTQLRQHAYSALADNTQHSGIEFDYDLETRKISANVTATSVEAIQDAAQQLFTNAVHTNISFQYNDEFNNIHATVEMPKTVFMGTYNPDAPEYLVGQWVYYDGSFYEALYDMVGGYPPVPTDASNWAHRPLT